MLLSLLAYGVAGMFGSFAAMSFSYLHLATLIALSSVANRDVEAFVNGSQRRRGES